MCLCLYFTAVKLRHYLLSRETFVIARTDLIKHMLTRPFLKGRIGKWILPERAQLRKLHFIEILRLYTLKDI